ncbi:hypothetical protein ACS126_03530 [Sphingobacterium lactis]|uniref:hypothetical protein n=1 Tax=Sphingobacterium TaxID=28453 RepID=UPI0021A6FF39|nr:hypothetical protein [Sphingobacterium hotanense]MCT1526082.1 hypothetical protein [Sphingobacterium hotanense]
MGLTSFFSNILSGKSSSWGGTPEMFLAMVLHIQKSNNPQYSALEVLQWGDVLQKIIKVKLSPYKDFKDLLERGEPDFSIIQEVESQIAERHQRMELKKAIYGENVDLGDDDIMTSDSEGAVFARNFVKKMSKYVQFSDDDQKRIDDI